MNDKNSKFSFKYSEELYRSLFENISNGVAIYETVNNGENFVFKNLNKFGQELENVRLEDIVGKKITEIFPGVVEFGLFDVLKEVYRTGIPKNHPIGVYKDERILGYRENYVYKLESGEIVAVYSDRTKEKIAEKNLIAERKELEITLSSIGDGVVTTDNHSNILFLNKVAEKLSGWTLNEVRGKPIDEVFKLIHEISREDLEFPVRRVLETKQPVEMANHTALISKNGDEIIISDSAAPILDEDGILNGVVLVFRDVTHIKEAKKVEEELKRLTIMLDSMPEIIYVVDPNTYEIIFANKTIRTAFNRPLVGEICYEALQNKIKPCEFCTNDIIMNNQGEPYEWEYHNPVINTDYLINDRIIKWPDGRKVRFESALDITDKKILEKKYYNTYEQAAVGIAHVSLDGKFLNVNTKFCDIIGYSKEEVKNLTFQDITYPDDLGIDLYYVNQILEDKIKTYSMDKRYFKKDKSIVWITLTVSLVHDINNKPEYFVSVIQDISEKKKYEKQIKEYSENLEKMVEQRTEKIQDMHDLLLRQEKLASIGKLAGIIGHELRNPLGVINNSIYYLNMKIKNPDDKVAKHLNIIDREIKRSNRIIKGLLDFSREKKLSLEPTDLNNLIKTQITTLEIPENIDLIYNLSPDLEQIKIDKDKIIQVVNNLVINAIQEMKDGGKLEITTKNNENGIILSIKDSGRGITEENLSKIFEPLFTTKTAGIGLGLCIVKEIIEKHNGKIYVKTELSKGTEMIIEIPIIEND